MLGRVPDEASMEKWTPSMEHTRRGVVGLGRSKDVLAELKAEALHMNAINPINARHAPCTCIETL